MRVKVSKEALKSFEAYLEKDDEVSGCFIIRDKMLYIEYSSIRDGEKFTVRLGSCSNNFHVHPKKAYIYNGCHLGWPSGDDMKYIYSKKVKNHIIVSVEGLYVINILKDNFCEECIFEFYQNLEKNRCKNSNSINLVNTFIRNSNLFGVFKIKFYLWGDFKYINII
jgi:hypothetical protein